MIFVELGIAFFFLCCISSYLQVEECLELLVSAGRVPEAAFMARTYLPSAMGRLVALWKKDLAKVSTKVSLGGGGGSSSGSSSSSCSCCDCW